MNALSFLDSRLQVINIYDPQLSPWNLQIPFQILPFQIASTKTSTKTSDLKYNQSTHTNSKASNTSQWVLKNG